MAGQYNFLWTGQYDKKWNTMWCIVDQSQDVCDVLYVIISETACLVWWAVCIPAEAGADRGETESAVAPASEYRAGRGQAFRRQG